MKTHNQKKMLQMKNQKTGRDHSKKTTSGNIIKKDFNKDTISQTMTQNSYAFVQLSASSNQVV